MRPTDTTAKQPLELVREYFGEKIALFYTWFGFYCAMLWVTSLFSIFVFGTQVSFCRAESDMTPET